MSKFRKPVFTGLLLFTSLLFTAEAMAGSLQTQTPRSNSARSKLQLSKDEIEKQILRNMYEVAYHEALDAVSRAKLPGSSFPFAYQLSDQQRRQRNGPDAESKNVARVLQLLETLLDSSVTRLKAQETLWDILMEVKAASETKEQIAARFRTSEWADDAGSAGLFSAGVQNRNATVPSW